jgi:anti-sigma-K factor RskA
LNHERATEDIREQAALYALGSLTQHEARSFEMHLREGCAVCEAELRRFERTVAGIGFAVDEAETPEYLRDLLLARIEREPQEAIAAVVPERKDDLEHPKERPSPPHMAQSILFGSPEKSSRGFPWMLAVALSAIAALGITLYALTSARSTNSQLQSKLSAVQADFDNLNLLLDSQEEKAGRLDKILATSGMPGVQMAHLAEQNTTQSSLGLILWNVPQNRCLILGSFPPAAAQESYELWFSTPSAKVAIGLINPDPTGRVFVDAPVPKEAANATLAIITLEPKGGSQTPKVPFYAIGRFN